MSEYFNGRLSTVGSTRSKKSKQNIQFESTTSLSTASTDGIPSQRQPSVRHHPDLSNLAHKRTDFKVLLNNQDATPKTLSEFDTSNYEEFLLIEKNKSRVGSRPPLFEQSTGSRLFNDEILSHRSLESALGSIQTVQSIFNITMDDITSQILPPPSEDQPIAQEVHASAMEEPTSLKMPQPRTFIKILLSETVDFILFENRSKTVLKNSDEAKLVEADNARYEQLVTTGKSRYKLDAEAQTNDVLFKSRTANTLRIQNISVGTFVSNYDMYDTYADLKRFTSETSLGDKKIEITTYSSIETRNLLEFLNKSAKFKQAAMIIERLLAGNVFRDRQKRFRNMKLPNPLDLSAKLIYSLNVMWTYKTNEVLGRQVSSCAWCKTNGDILAVGYGTYHFQKNKDRRSGFIYVWNIKNPVNPEHRVRYQVPVTAVAFSRKSPQLLAVGLFDGSTEIRDISHEDIKLIAKSDRRTSPGFEPVSGLVWLDSDASDEKSLLAISLDGRVMRYTIGNSPHLISFHQLQLERLEGVAEGLPLVRKDIFLEAFRKPQALCIQMHPKLSNIYFVGTDEGCIHTCSINIAHQHLNVLQAHRGGITCIQYSPWGNAKVYLTSGNDWCIRIWLEDVNEPIMELPSDFSPVQQACWSPIHATIIASVTRNSVDIWDIRRRTLKPAATHVFGGDTAPLTVIRFTECGRSLVVGDGDGTTYVCALENMPFTPHFQSAELDKALLKSLVANPALLKKVNIVESLRSGSTSLD